MDSLMKMVAVALLVLWDVAQGNEDPCRYVAVGDSVTISLQRSADCVESSLTWKLNSTDIFRRKQHVRLGKDSDVTSDGSLQLVDLQRHKSGEYKAELYNAGGMICGKATETLCVIERVSKPSVTYTCSKDSVTLTCNGEESDIKWSFNRLSMEGEFKKTVTVPGRPDHNVNYSCTAWDTVSEETSDELTIRCPVLLSMKVNQDVREGGEVSILCNSTPTADQYIFRTPRSKHPVLVNADGEFRLQEVTKDDGGLYTCQPRWTHGLYDDANVTVQLRVLPNEGSGGVTPRVASGTENRLLLLATHCWLLLYLLALTD
ncbi:hypothetical protein SKAU_G00322980 [Synaphobranchus kaupii]|uniref:Ig-like domain-containing protein n=1 Tax=Synaphobranchus kaupii TaxID=118154 RepID=A0A9Q1EP78_SYNKA|nr:hypothetical protein SKAU_G00322980 [Synaphobranchus kaupii]